MTILPFVNPVRTGYFRCAICDQDVPVEDISEYSLYIAGTRNVGRALAILDAGDLMCADCDEDSEPMELEEESIFAERYSGIELDRCALDWLSLNY